MSHTGDVHVTPDWQLADPVHVTSHAHEALHMMFLHELGPEQLVSHGPGPHSTFWHDCRPEHSTVHDCAAVQSTPLRHELSVLHWTSHL